jgi:hypothetical protein
MNISESNLWTRKDIARMLGPNVTERQVRANERRWGLASARVRLKTRSVLYCGRRVVAVLRQAGVIE